MPRISAPTVVAHREAQRLALLEAASELMASGTPFTVAEVAKHVGLSRSAVYQYYNSSADLIADVLVDELAMWADDLAQAATPDHEPLERVRLWISAVIDYVASGKHSLVRAAGSIDLPETRKAQVQGMHRELIAPLYESLLALGVDDAARVSHYVWGVVDAAITRIEVQHCSPDEERDALLEFVARALR